jgi:hypothetical protein
MDQIHLSPLVDQIQLTLGHISNNYTCLLSSATSLAYFCMIFFATASSVTVWLLPDASLCVVVFTSSAFQARFVGENGDV